MRFFNKFEWISIALATCAVAIFVLLMFGVKARAHETVWRNAAGDPQILDFQKWENPKNRRGCCGENDCRPIDQTTLIWSADAVSFIHDKTGSPQRYWIPRDEIDGSPNQTTYGCVVDAGDNESHPSFPGQKKARCLMLSGST